MGKSWKRLFTGAGGALVSIPTMVAASVMSGAGPLELAGIALCWTVGGLAALIGGVSFIMLAVDALDLDGDWSWTPLRDAHAKCYQRIVAKDREIAELREALITLRLPASQPPTGERG